MIAHSVRNSVERDVAVEKNSVTSDADAATMNTGISKIENQISANEMLPSRPTPRPRNQMWRKRRVTWTLPRPQRSRCFHSAGDVARLLGPDDRVRLEDDALARRAGC